MKSAIDLSVLCAVLGLVMAASSGKAEPGEPNTLSNADRAAGWRLLFDGETTAGWRNYRSDTISSGWQVVDGTLARVGKAGDIVTTEQFGDFELELDWRVQTGGNSGVFLRVGEVDPYIFMSAPEMQILDDANHRDGASPLTSAGSNFALHPAPRGVVLPAGQWNRSRVRMSGEEVVMWLNGQEVVRYRLGSADWREKVRNSKFADWPNYGTLTRGHIGLQDHGDPVAFRNVRIRVLASDT